MKRLAVLVLTGVGLSVIPACGGDQAGCEEALAAFETQKETCGDSDASADPWFSQATCDTANDDGYDNSEFYTCLTEKFSGTDTAVACDGDNTVRQFEDISQDSDPPGCRELYNASPQ